MSAEKTFLLGIGAQKSGTTWLHSYLDTFDEASLGILKEYHIWDALEVPEMAHFDQRGGQSSLPTRAQRRLRELLGLRTPSLQAQMQRDARAYFDYFAGLLEVDGASITADITPSYSVLSAGTLRKIRDGFAARGISVRSVFLMRDPVERCWSAVQMYKGMEGRDALARNEGVDVSLDDIDAFEAYIRTPQAWQRTDYRNPLTAMSEVFPEEATFIGTYERLFTQSEVERFSRFVGLPTKSEFMSHRVNSSSKKQAMDPSLREAAKRHFAPIYEFVGQNYPWIADAWSDYDQNLSAG